LVKGALEDFRQGRDSGCQLGSIVGLWIKVFGDAIPLLCDQKCLHYWKGVP
jgi:hypothetical protein